MREESSVPLDALMICYLKGERIQFNAFAMENENDRESVVKESWLGLIQSSDTLTFRPEAIVGLG